MIEVTPGTDLADGAVARAKEAAVIVIRVAPQAETGDANHVAHTLAVAAADLLDQVPSSVMAMTGGDTAMAVPSHLGGTCD